MVAEYEQRFKFRVKTAAFFSYGSSVYREKICSCAKLIVSLKCCMAFINIKVQSLCTSSRVKLIFSLSILLMTKSFAQVPQQLGINLFEQYDSPQALFEAFGKDINTDKIDVDFDLTGTGFKTTDNYDGSLTEIPEYILGVPKLEQWN